MPFNEFDDEDTEGTNVNVTDSSNPSHKAKVDEQGNTFSKITLGDIAQIDPWGKIRTTVPTTLFEANFNFSERPLIMNTKLVNGGTRALNLNVAGVDMTVPTTSGASVIRQTQRYFRYVTGKGSLILTGFRPSAPKTNQYKAWGYFDARDGKFFRQTETGLEVVIRSSISGTPTDLARPQAEWNLDRLDGTGASGINIDQEAHNVWVIDFTWQGAGSVRFGLFFNGRIYYCHEYRPSNTLTTPYTRTPVLPIRYEITNTGVTPSPTTVTHGTLGFIVDGSGQLSDVALNFSDSNQQIARSVTTTLLPIIAMRPKLTYNGITNRVPIELTSVEVVSETQLLYYQVIKGATVSGGTWVSSDVNSAVEVNRGATTYSGGTKIAEGYVLAAAQGNNVRSESAVITLNKLNYIGLDIDGTTQDSFLVVARTIGNTTNTFCSLSWEEFQ